jgi:hypothetical protein
MEQLHLDDFDAWAATFGETVDSIEVVPEGGGLRMNSRFARFYYVPELLRILHQVADVKTADDLNLPVPRLREREDGQRAPRTLVVPASDKLGDYLTALVDRADLVRRRLVDPSEDNLLKITHNGRSATMDLRLVPATAAEIADVLCRYEVLDNEETIAALATPSPPSGRGTGPTPRPDTIVWPTELREEHGATLWPGRFEYTVETALLDLAAAHDWDSGPLTSDQLLAVTAYRDIGAEQPLTAGQLAAVMDTYDGMADPQIRQRLADELADLWSEQRPGPRQFGAR